MRLEERYDKVLAWFRERMPVADTELQYNDPFQLLVAVILSAQCTDKRVNMVTPALFEQFPDAESMSKASVEEIFELIKSISYPNNKSKHLSAMAKKLMEDFDGLSRMISSYCDVARGGTEDGQCYGSGGFQASGYACRHARFPGS